jgi:hypothetical protein
MVPWKIVASIVEKMVDLDTSHKCVVGMDKIYCNDVIQIKA